MTNITTTALLGADVIGASWTALFLAAGKDVRVFDVADDVEKTVNDYIKQAWPTLKELGLVKDRQGKVSSHNSPEEAAKKEVEYSNQEKK